jgi:putative inorganic carbon (hco3(-)) transporter
VIRTTVVIVALTVGWTFALQGPLYAACLYLWIAYFRPESWAWSDIFVTLNLSYVAGAYLVFRTLISGIRWRFDFRTSLLVLFLAQALLSSWLGLHSALSLSHWQDFAKIAIVSILLTNIIRTERELRLILMVIAFSLGFEAVKQGWANLILHPGMRNDNPVPFLGDNNLVAVGMSMLLPVITALGATSTGWHKRVFQFMNVGVLYRAISTYSRGGMLSVCAVGTVYFWRSPHKLRAAAAVIVALLVIVPVLPPVFWDRMSTIAAAEDERDASQQGRLHFWNVALAMANDRPFVGVGHSGYEQAYNQYDSSNGQFGTNRAAHSAWLGILAELGYPGLILFVTIVLSSLLACGRVRRAARRREVSEALGAYAVALETALIAFIVGGSFVSFQYCEMLWHFFALSVAVERVAVAEAATLRERREFEQLQQQHGQQSPEEPVPDFAWA